MTTTLTYWVARTKTTCDQSLYIRGDTKKLVAERVAEGFLEGVEYETPKKVSVTYESPLNLLDMCFGYEGVWEEDDE